MSFEVSGVGGKVLQDSVIALNRRSPVQSADAYGPRAIHQHIQWKEVLSGGAILALPAPSFPSRGNDMSRSSALSSFASKKYLLKSCKQRLSERLKERTGFKIVSEEPRLLSTNC